MNDKTDTDRSGRRTPTDPRGERYRLADDKKSLEVLFTVDDPKFFTTAWSGRADYRRDNRPLRELICAENNQPLAMGDQPPIPTATKPDF